MAKAHKIVGVEPQHSYIANARIILPQKVEEVYAWERFIRDPARNKELHNMRISIKRLRYTMELFGVAFCRNTLAKTPKVCARKVEINYDEPFTEFLAVIVDLQEILGDIHDCDVVLEVLSDYQKTKSDLVKCGMAEARGPGPTVRSGIDTLIARTRETRKADYETFLEKWEQLSAKGFKQKLLALFGVACPAKNLL